jgi:hypothetical protein
MLGVVGGWILVGLGLAVFVFPPKTAKQRAELAPLWLALPLVALQIWAGDRSGISGAPIPLGVLYVDGLTIIGISAIGHLRYGRRLARTGIPS